MFVVCETAVAELLGRGNVAAAVTVSNMVFRKSAHVGAQLPDSEVASPCATMSALVRSGSAFEKMERASKRE